MKAISKSFLFILFLLLVACSKDDEVFSDSANQLIGSWIYTVMDDSYIIYERVDRLEEQREGMTFKSKKKFINRSINSWCGTPPVVYADYEGSWSEKDSIISITVEYWGGKTSYQWKIISVDDKYLKLSPIMQLD